MKIDALKIDVNGDGFVDHIEIAALIEKNIQSAAMNRLFQRIIAGLIICMVIMICALTGSIYGVVVLVKDMQTSEATGQLTTRGGRQVLTGNSDFCIASNGFAVSRNSDGNCPANAPDSTDATSAIAPSTTSIKTEMAKKRAALSSLYTDDYFAELISVTLTSPTGANLHLNVNGFLRKAVDADNIIGAVTLLTRYNPLSDRMNVFVYTVVVIAWFVSTILAVLATLTSLEMKCFTRIPPMISFLQRMGLSLSMP